MPLDTDRKPRRVGNTDRFDCAVFRHTLDHDALAGVENPLAMKRIHADNILTKEFGEDSPRDQADIMPIGKHM